MRGGLTLHIKNDKLGMHSIGGRLVLRGVVLGVSKICTRIALHKKDTVSLQENHVTHVVSDFQRGCFHEFRLAMLGSRFDVIILCLTAITFSYRRHVGTSIA